MKTSVPTPGVVPLSEGQRLVALRRGWIRQWIKDHPRTCNWLLASLNFLIMAGSTLLGLGEDAYPAGVYTSHLPWVMPIILLSGVVVCTVFILCRKRYPSLFFYLTLAFEIVFTLFVGVNTSYTITGITTLILLYTVAAEQSLRHTIWAYVIYGVMGILGTFPLLNNDAFDISVDQSPVNYKENPTPYISLAIFIIVFFLAANLIVVMLGRFTHKNSEFDREIIERFEQTQTLAATEERTRIAREMHDVVAHSLTVMIALADGARIVGKKNPERAEEVLSELSNTGRTALADMRRTLGVLRDPSSQRAPLSPAEGVSSNAIENLEELVDSFAATGLPVEFFHEGQELPADHNLRLSLYRIVQESLTNALRYGRNIQKVSVRLSVVLPDIWVSVVNDGSTALNSPRERGVELNNLGSGKGLAGIRERAAFYGGTVEAGPNDVGGWTTRAHLIWHAPEGLKGRSA